MDSQFQEADRPATNGREVELVEMGVPMFSRALVGAEMVGDLRKRPLVERLLRLAFFQDPLA
jgi:hypothetical protein